MGSAEPIEKALKTRKAVPINHGGVCILKRLHAACNMPLLKVCMRAPPPHAHLHIQQLSDMLCPSKSLASLLHLLITHHLHPVTASTEGTHWLLHTNIAAGTSALT